MTTLRMLPWLLAGLVCAAALPARAGDAAPAPTQATASSPVRSSEATKEATKTRQEADRQRLVAKLRGEAPKVQDRPTQTSVLDLPIFSRHDKP